MLETMETLKLGHEEIEGFQGNEGDHRKRFAKVPSISRCREVGSVGIHVNRSLGQ